VLLVPESQRFRIFGSKEKSSDSGHFFHFRSSGDFIANSGPGRGRSMQLASRKKNPMLLPGRAPPAVSAYPQAQLFRLTSWSPGPLTRLLARQYLEIAD
jgi:hypothetical protein